MELIGTSEEMVRVRTLLPRIATGDSSVLLLGEAGTGREHVARQIHLMSRRADKPFAVVACGTCSDGEELFGTPEVPGLLQRCSEGTVYLSEIDELAMPMQAKLARFVDSGVQGELEFEPPRLLASARRNLAPLITRGRFRGDLYYRLSAVTVRLPALRDRRGDLPLLAAHFLDRSAKLLGKRFDGISGEALALMQQYPWDGNLNELVSAMERAAVVETGRELSSESLPPTLHQSSGMVATG